MIQYINPQLFTLSVEKEILINMEQEDKVCEVAIMKKIGLSRLMDRHN